MKSALLLILFTSFSWGFDVGNGKSLVVTFNDSHGILALKDRNITILPHPRNAQEGFAILPIDYHTSPQTIEAQWLRHDENLTLNLDIVNASYPTETLSVESAKVTPPPETLERIAQEKAEAEKIYGTYNAVRYWDKPFIRPIESITTSEYGSSRTYNGVLKSYHGGIDFRAKTPLPILASNDGVVVLAKDRYYSGGTVILDHGEGVYTCYFHFSQIDVQVGQRVARGESIGLSGATGRITGPHLHFGIMVHAVQTDPLDFMAQIETLFTPPFVVAQNTQKVPK
ncbi:MAG TPA: M23 family metallopeptidase [Sulfuricurvum sp.]|nr:M23 family metallopeptidase [Sulfuricurvum sp.]